MTLKKFLFVDLDDTLFQTPKKCLDQNGLLPAAYLKDGSACSYTTARQRAFLTFAQHDMTLIPATARNCDAYRRVDLPFSSYAIIDYGGVILTPDGAPDSAWLATMQDQMAAACPGLRDVMQQIDDYAQRCGMQGRARLIEDYDTPFYVVVKDPQGQTELLAQIERAVLTPWLADAGQDYFIHRNGNNLAVLPKALNKAHAVDYLRQRLMADHGEILTFGMGDSQSDARFMAACDYAIVPGGTQLANLMAATARESA
jgi:hydroxymethylpyrimidine pyrophosphatase-like HAD family hydrolase